LDWMFNILFPGNISKYSQFPKPLKFITQKNPHLALSGWRTQWT